MEYVTLGRCGLRVSRLGLGAMGFGDKSWRGWVLDVDESRTIVDRALELGINFFDTCDYYSAGRSEEILGATLLARVPREDIVLATKLGMPMREGANDRGYSRKHVLAAVDASLQRLGTEYIDLYQTHIWDRSANIEELLEALDHLVSCGKILHAGVTDMPAWQLAKALAISERRGLSRFVSVQNHYNLIYREDERELMPLSRDQGLGLISYSPMGRGFLAGNRRTGDWGDTERARTDDFAQNLYFRESDFEVARRVAEVAVRMDVEPVQVALAWVLDTPGMSAPVFGATRPEHVDIAVEALELTLSPEDAAYLEAAYLPRPLPAR